MFAVLHNLRLDPAAAGVHGAGGHRRLPRRLSRSRRAAAPRNAGAHPETRTRVFMGDERETTDGGW
jgi:hypothetical protein